MRAGADCRIRAFMTAFRLCGERPGGVIVQATGSLALDGGGSGDFVFAHVGNRQEAVVWGARFEAGFRPEGDIGR
jgi:hypothetical protein